MATPKKDQASEIERLCETYSLSLQDGNDEIDHLLAPFAGDQRQVILTQLLTVQESHAASLGETSSFDSPSEDRRATTEVFKPAGHSTPKKYLHPLLESASLRGLSEAAIKDLVTKLDPCRFETGQLLLRQGELAAHMFVLTVGKVEIEVASVDESTMIDTSGSGDILGEMSLLTNTPCTASVKAVCDVEALSLSRQDYECLILIYPELEIALSQIVSDRLGSKATDALTGKSIGDYQLQRCINRGGMGVVYEALGKDGRNVALKMLRHRFIRKESVIQGFLREGKLLARLSHPNILSVTDCFVAFNTRFLVMDFWGGEDLSGIIKRNGSLQEDVCRPILGQLAGALSYAHRAGVLHLDIKPANVLLAKDGRVALSDFGLCRLAGEAGDSKSIVGTLPYMPPEQFELGELDEAADWYALACTAVEMLTGKRLFRQPNFRQLRRAKIDKIPDKDWPELKVSNELREVLASALQPHRSQRTLDLELLETWSQHVPGLFV